MKEKFLFGFDFEHNTRFYEKIGIRIYKYLIPTLGDFWIRTYERIFDKEIKLLSTRKKAVNFTNMTLVYELIHYFGFVFLLALNVVVFVQGKVGWTLIILLMNIIINIYSIFLQRYNRIRLIKIFDIRKNELDLSNVAITHNE